MPRRRSDHRPCRGGARRVDRQPGSWCRSSRATAGQAGAAPVPRRAVVPIDGGKVVPIIQGHGLATAAVVPVVPVRNCGQCAAAPIIDLAAVVPVVLIDSREAGARRAVPPCRSSRATAWQRPRWCPWFSSCPPSTAGRSCRAAVPIIDLAAVVPVVSIDSREAGADHPGPRPGKPVPRRSPVVPCRRADRRRPVSGKVMPIDGGKVVPVMPCRPCRSSRATAGQAGAAPVPRRAVVPIDGGKVVPIIQGHGSQRPRWCPSCRSTAGKLVPIIQGHGRATAAVVSVVSVMPIIDGGKAMPVMPCRRADHRPCRGRARRADRQPGSWCRSSRATAGQAGAAPVPRRAVPPCRSTPAGVREGRADRRREGGARHAVPIIDLAAVVPVVPIDSREAGADHPGPRPGKLVPRRSPVVPCRRADRRRPVSGKVVPIDGGKVVPVMPRRSSTLPRSCPSCRSTAGKLVPVVPCRRADHPGPRPGNGRGGARGFRHAHHRRREGRAVPPFRSSTLPRWCPSCRSTAGKLVPIIQGHGRASRCRAGPPSCRAAVPIDAGRCPGRSCRSTAGRWCPSCRAAVPIIQGHGRASWCRAGPPSCRRAD